MRIVEGSAFVAAPLGGMAMAQLGADVIRFDPIGGGLDRTRWPVTADGQSLFWAGLNKGKRSVQVDIRSEEGRELVAALITARARGRPVLTNFPARGFLDYEMLAARRSDLIMVNIVGTPTAPRRWTTRSIRPPVSWATGPRNLSVPFNHLLPAWDAITGMLATTSLLAAERRRARTVRASACRWRCRTWRSDGGEPGQDRRVQINQHERIKDGIPYGAFGRDFMNRDGRRVMIVGLTLRQWRNLVKATGLNEAFDASRSYGRRPRPRERSLCRARGDRSHAQAVGAGPDARAVREKFDSHDVSCGALPAFTQPWRRTRWCHRRARCSRRSINRASERT